MADALSTEEQTAVQHEAQESAEAETASQEIQLAQASEQQRLSVDPAAWLAQDARNTPLWLRTLHASLPITAVCVLHGEIHDLHPAMLGGRICPVQTAHAVWTVLQASDFDALLTFDPLGGLSIAHTKDGTEPHNIQRALEDACGKTVIQNLLRTSAERAESSAQAPQQAQSGFDGLDAVAEAVAQSESPAMALLIDYTSQVRSDQMADDEALKQLMLASLEISDAHSVFHGKAVRFECPAHACRIRRPIIWLVDKMDDLPVWLTSGDGIRQLPITKPDIDMRIGLAHMLLAPEVEAQQLDELSKRLADATDSFSMRGMFEAVQLARGSRPITETLEGAVRTYREGLWESPWQSARLREQLANGKEILTRRVLGQDGAVNHVLDTLRRSVLGLTGAHSKNQSSGPRGVLYFAGPTGVGKTELAKSIAELVFSNEQALVRFDMSEFQDSHAKIRLVGAPPSYVGYGAGGELTNAVQTRPHSVVLFDEMDKAGRQVNDLFLQILSDGRLTDGSGRTVSFTETLIIFTSNQGIAANNDALNALDLDVPEDATRYEEIIKEAVKQHFREELGRPELLGRLGDNIVVFHPMRGQVARDLANKFLDTILSNVRIRVGNVVEIADAAREELIDAVTTQDVLSNGGRGITMALEDQLINPLGGVLFDLDAEQEILITRLGADAHGRPALEVELR